MSAYLIRQIANEIVEARNTQNKKKKKEMVKCRHVADVAIIIYRRRI